MFLVPVGQHVIGGLLQRRVGFGQRGIDHGQFMRVRADRLDVAMHGDQAVRGAGEPVAQPLDHGLHGPVLPQEAVAAAGPEIGDAQIVQLAQRLDLFPQARHGAGIKDLQLEPAHILQDGAGPQLHQDRQGRNFPQHHLGPLALEGQFILPVMLAQVIGGQAQTLQDHSMKSGRNIWRLP